MKAQLLGGTATRKWLANSRKPTQVIACEGLRWIAFAAYKTTFYFCSKKRNMLIWAILISLVTTGLLYWVTMSLKTDAQFSIFSWLISLALFIVLSLENVLLINAIEKRSYSDDIASSVKTCLKASLPSVVSDYVLSAEEAQFLSLQLKVAFPGMSKYIKTSYLEGHPVSEVTDIVSHLLHKSFGKRIWKLGGWILLTLIIGETLIVLTMEKRHHFVSRGRTTHSYDDF